MQVQITNNKRGLPFRAFRTGLSTSPIERPDVELYPITPLFLAVLAFCLIGGERRLLLLLAAMMPLGMLAVVGLPSVGGLSILAVNLSAATLVGLGVLLLLARLFNRVPLRIEPATLALVLFAGYSIFSATVLVRLFAGETMVFPLSRGDTGVKVSTLFSWGKVWLSPSSSNLSQTFYIVLASGTFVALTSVLARQGTAFGAHCMAVAAGVNLAFGLLDLAALDTLLEVVRTANYSLANTASVNGIPRVIGGYSEAASFGSACAMFFAYFGSAALTSGRWRDWVLAIGNGVFTVLALSSTGLIALAFVILILFIRILKNMPSRVSPMGLIRTICGLTALAVGIAAVLVFTQAPEMIAAVVDDLILNKSQSTSGFERKAWSLGGLEALRDTWGLGAGTGSLRSNGLTFVLLGSVGIPGTLAFLGFLWLAFYGQAVDGQAGNLSNARIAAFAILVSMSLTATVPDPGVPLILLAAIAVSARRVQPDTIFQNPTKNYQENVLV